MATFHFAVTAIRRAAGRSVVAAAAYRACQRICDERTGLVHDYTRKAGHIRSGVFGWSGGVGSLWNAAEAAERRGNSVVAREITLALPHELDARQHWSLAEAFAEALGHRHQMAASVHLHEAHRLGDDRNVHAHMLVTTRRVIEGRALGEKTRELDTKPSSSAHVTAWRELWEAMVNRALQEAGLAVRVDSRSMRTREQAGETPRLPLAKLGPAATMMERRGIRTAKGDRNRRRKRQNTQLASLHCEARQLKAVSDELRVEETIAEVRRISKDHPVPVHARAATFETMFTTAATAWEANWPHRLARAVRRALPRELRSIVFVSRRLKSGGLISAGLVPAVEAFCSCLDEVLREPEPRARLRMR